MAPSTSRRRRPASTALMVPLPRMIDIASLEDLWSEIAAEVPMLADPDGDFPPFSWDLLDQPEASESSQFSEDRSREAIPESGPEVPLDKAEAVQEHINGIVGRKKERETREVREKFHAAIGRAADRAGDLAKERQKQDEEEVLDRAGAALRAAADRRVKEDSSTIAGDSTAVSSASSSSSSAWPTSGGLDSSSSVSGEEDQLSSDDVQAQIQKATEAARKRRQAEAQSMRNTGEDIQRAAREAWERREAASLEAQAIACAGAAGGWGGSNGTNTISIRTQSVVDDDGGGSWQAVSDGSMQLDSVRNTVNWPGAIPIAVMQQPVANMTQLAPMKAGIAYTGMPAPPPLHAAPGYMPTSNPCQEAMRGWNVPPPSQAHAWAYSVLFSSNMGGAAGHGMISSGPWNQFGMFVGDASDRGYAAKAMHMQQQQLQQLQQQQQQQQQQQLFGLQQPLAPQWGGF
mmetsp:Transcript_85777/g.218713  ORF Transcript_85777/g.218713 Transcript_85777/m.218713 type:complete len:459 (+) Transcript_85777:99-1475(+)